MEQLLIIVVLIFLLAVIALFVLGYRSNSGEAPGLAEGRLQPCPGASNCVNSEFASEAEHCIEALVYSADQAAQALPRLKTIIGEMGGIIQAETTDYLAATFTSSIFRFVDDLEIRIDAAQNTIHLRSASRVGRSDLGANRQRVERLKSLFLSTQN